MKIINFLSVFENQSISDVTWQLKINRLSFQRWRMYVNVFNSTFMSTPNTFINNEALHELQDIQIYFS